MIIENIYKFLDYKGITAYEISKKIKISNGYLAKTRQNRGNVGGHILEKIVNYYPEINSEWLLTSKGSMLKDTIAQVSTTIVSPSEEILKDKLIVNQEKTIAMQEREIKRIEQENKVLTKENRLLKQFPIIEKEQTKKIG